MTTYRIDDFDSPIGEVLQLVGSDGILLQPQGQSPLALIPLDDDVLDFLIERNPRFIDDCRRIRERIARGAVHSQQESTLCLDVSATRQSRIHLARNGFP